MKCTSALDCHWVLMGTTTLLKSARYLMSSLCHNSAAHFHQFGENPKSSKVGLTDQFHGMIQLKGWNKSSEGLKTCNPGCILMEKRWGGWETLSLWKADRFLMSVDLTLNGRPENSHCAITIDSGPKTWRGKATSLWKKKMLRDIKGSVAEQISCAGHCRVLINDGWTGAIPNQAIEMKKHCQMQFQLWLKSLDWR